VILIVNLLVVIQTNYAPFQKAFTSPLVSNSIYYKLQARNDNDVSQIARKTGAL